MKIYVAGPWARKDEAARVAQQIEDMGHRITMDWWNHDHPWEATAALRKSAQEDIQAVINADLMVVLNSQTSEGKAVEQGIAIMQGMPIMIVGDRTTTKNIFHHLDNYTWLGDLDELWEALEAYEEPSWAV